MHNCYEVESAHTGTEGLKKAIEKEYHAVILDVMLPEMDGFELLRQLRAESLVPVLMLTSRGDETDRIVGLEMGADDYLPKTFSTCELLSFTRAEIGSEKVAAATVPLRPVILAIMEREGAKGVKILNRVDDDISVWAVDGLLRRALSNILRNAVRYAGHEGPIEITAQRESDKVLIAITDHGPGVPEVSIGRLFEPFYRPEAVRNRKSGGVGLGLAIVKTCAQACGGTVHAKNLSPRGFSITMTLLASKP